MRAHKHKASVTLLLFVQFLHCFTRRACLFKANKSAIRKGVSRSILLHVAGSYFAKLFENFAKSCVFDAHWQALNENIVGKFLGLRYLGFLLIVTFLFMSKDFKLFSFELQTVCLLNCFRSVSFLFELNKTEAAACSIVVALKFTFNDGAILNVQVIKLLLIYVSRNISD